MITKLRNGIVEVLILHITISAVNQDVKLQKLDGEVTEGHKSGVSLLTQYVKNSFSSRQTSIKTVEHCVT